MTSRALIAAFVVACGSRKSEPPPAPPPPAPPAPAADAAVKHGPRPIAIGMSDRSAIALLDDGTLRAWGNGADGLLGNGKSADAATPIVVPGITGADLLEVDSSLACAHLRAGGWTCWGNDSDLPGARDAVRKPAVVHAFDHMRVLRLNGRYGCGIRDDGHVDCWGQIPPGRGEAATKPLTAIAALHDVTALSYGGATACALEKDGSVWCWGEDNIGQASATTALPAHERVVPLPHRIPGIDDAVAIGIGVKTSCARRRSGDLACWGGLFALLGVQQVPAKPSSQFVDVSFDPCELTENGEVRCLEPGVSWKSFRDEHITAIATDHDSTCAIETDDAIHCWGKNDVGQLGDGTLAGRDTSKPVVSLVDVAPPSTPAPVARPGEQTTSWDQRPADCPYDADLELASPALPGSFHVVAAFARSLDPLLEIDIANHPLLPAEVGHPLTESGPQRSVRLVLSESAKGRFPLVEYGHGRSAEVILGDAHTYASSIDPKSKLSGAVEITRFDAWVCGKIDVSGPGGRIRGRFAAEVLGHQGL